MATKPNVAELVSQMPEVDKPGTASKFTGPDPVAAAKIFAEIFAGGSGSILELIDLVKAPEDADFKDYKAALEQVEGVLKLEANNPEAMGIREQAQSAISEIETWSGVARAAMARGADALDTDGMLVVLGMLAA